jgi:hypothetical protein
LEAAWDFPGLARFLRFALVASLFFDLFLGIFVEKWSFFYKWIIAD